MDVKLLKKMRYYVRIRKQDNLYMLEKRYSTRNKWLATVETDNLFAVTRYKHNAWSALLYAFGYGAEILKRFRR